MFLLEEKCRVTESSKIILPSTEHAKFDGKFHLKTLPK